MSSHIFQEIEKTCNRVAVIKNGRIISEVDMKAIEYNDVKTFDVQYENAADMQKVQNNDFEIVSTNAKWNSVQYRVNTKNIDEFIKAISKYKLKFMREIPYTLEEYFMKFYAADDSESGVSK